MEDDSSSQTWPLHLLLPTGPGIDRTPFVVELVANPFPGDPLVARRGDMCVSLREYAECEWGGPAESDDVGAILGGP